MTLDAPHHLIFFDYATVTAPSAIFAAGSSGNNAGKLDPGPYLHRAAWIAVYTVNTAGIVVNCPMETIPAPVPGTPNPTAATTSASRTTHVAIIVDPTTGAESDWFESGDLSPLCAHR